jgi:xanthine dehydrogenase small subunit
MNTPIKFILNDREEQTSLPAGTVTLDLIRLHKGLSGTKESCREGECGSCTILLGELKNNRMCYKAVASCLLPIGELQGKHIVTIEGLNSPGLTRVQQALVDYGAIQCGFCTPGIVQSLTGFFLSDEKLDYPGAIDAIDGNICRCTGYVSIKKAAKSLCDSFAGKTRNNGRVEDLVKFSFVPDYFLRIPAMLQAIAARPPVPENGAEKIIAGGETDLFVQKPGELLERRFDFVSRREELSGIKEKNNEIHIGAAATVEEIKNSLLVERLFPEIKKYLRLVASKIIRNRATVAGNIANASPIADLTIFLLPLKSVVMLSKGNKKREVPLKSFFLGYKKLDMKKGEMILNIKFPIPGQEALFNFEKVSRRKHLDIAGCNSAICLEVKDTIISEIHLSAGGVAAVPLYLENTCRYLSGRELNVHNLREAVKIMQQEIAPISDIRGAADYKRLLLRQLFFAHFLKLFPKKIKPEELL